MKLIPYKLTKRAVLDQDALALRAYTPCIGSGWVDPSNVLHPPSIGMESYLELKLREDKQTLSSSLIKAYKKEEFLEKDEAIRKYGVIKDSYTSGILDFANSRLYLSSENDNFIRLFNKTFNTKCLRLDPDFTFIPKLIENSDKLGIILKPNLTYSNTKTTTILTGECIRYQLQETDVIEKINFVIDSERISYDVGTNSFTANKKNIELVVHILHDLIERVSTMELCKTPESILLG
jgi:hypothetical protein